MSVAYEDKYIWHPGDVEVEDDLTAAGWDESEHPRHPAGSDRGGEFARKEGAYTGDEPLGTDRDPGWEEDPLAPSLANFGDDTYNPISNSDAVWNGRLVPEMQYDLDTQYYMDALGGDAMRDDADVGEFISNYQSQVETAMRMVGEEGELRINTPFEVMEDIINGDERFKSQFETARSQGAFLPQIRAAQEEMFFGYPQDMPPERRPIYGWLDHPDAGFTQQSVLPQYGEVTWELKPELKARTTISFVDSLSRPVIPGPIRNPGWRATVPPGYTDDGTAQEIITDHVHETGLFDDIMETQYHGGVTLDDVAQVRVQVVEEFGGWGPEDFEKLREYRHQLGFKNIPLVVVNKDGEEIDIDAR